MHKATFLEGSLALTIAPDGPLLVKAGEGSGADPNLPSMEFVRTHQERGREVYIPGPSLKGVVRAQAERICRSLDTRHKGPDADDPPLADNPLGSGDTYHGPEDANYSDGRYLDKLREKQKDQNQHRQSVDGQDKRLLLTREHDNRALRTEVIYRRSSFTSRLFGNTSLAGRVRFADAYPSGEVRLEERNGVAIDRIYGSVAVGPFNYETVVGAEFATRINLKNVTLAQLALLGLALRDLADGRVAIGFGKSRGLGRVRVTFDSLELYYPTCEHKDGQLRLLNGARGVPDTELAGLAALCPTEAYAEYHFLKEGQHDQVPLPEGLAYHDDDLLGVRLLVKGDAQVRALWKACMPCWREALGL